MKDILSSISMIWSLGHVLVMFMFLYESRYSFKKTVWLTVATMAPLLILNGVLYVMVGRVFMSKILAFTITIPSLIFFYIISKYRDGRFVFTFCIVDTLSLGIIIATALLDKYLMGDAGIFLFISRLIAFPLIEWFAIKRLRKTYLLIQDSMKKGWSWFAAVATLFYLLIIVMMNVPVNILDNPTGIPAMVLLLILMPLMYYNIFRILHQQRKLLREKEQKNILKLERQHMEDILYTNAATEERIRIERHDLRHRMKSILAMLENQEYEEAMEYIRASTQFFDTNKIERHCQNPILDAVFTSFFSDAAEYNIRIESSLAIPNEIPVDATDLSIVFANALENAIHACQKLPEEERIIKCKYVIGPRHMFQVSNPYTGKVLLDANGRPTSHEDEHGIGTRSIMAFCDKYHAEADYKLDNGWFHLRIVL